jgi:murein DD-endopeptidase MepM/ murein hydrolase activator NlpD
MPSRQFFINILSFLLLLANCSLALPVQANTLQSNFDKQQSAINASLNNIKSEIGQAKNAFNDISKRKNSLQEEVKNVKTEIDNIDKLITEINITSAKLEGQIATLNEKIEAIQLDLKNMIREIQKMDQMSDIQIILTSKNLGDAYNQIRNLSELQSQSDSLARKLVESRKALEQNQQDLAASKKNLQDARFLIASRKDSLQQLLDETQGEESKYQQLLSGLMQQKTQLDAQAVEAQRKYEEELLKQQQAEAANNNGGNNSGGNSSGGGSGGGGSGIPTPPNVVGCYFEDKRALSVPSGYFVSPSAGVVTQDYNCSPGHDGVDVGNALGTALVAIANCTVQKKGFESGGFGHYVLLRCVLPSGSRVYPLYAHMRSATNLVVGESVARGAAVGSMGATGYVTGIHLHFMLISDTYESTGNIGCRYGNSKCYNPARFINF